MEPDEQYERRVIAFEAARNLAADAWFAARPQVERTIERERIFEGGFRMAWELRDKEGM